MSNYRELSQMVKTQKAQKETSAPVPVETSGGEDTRRTVRQTVRTGGRMLSTPYMQSRIEQLSEKKDLLWRAEQAEKRYQNYLNSDEYRQNTAKLRREAEERQNNYLLSGMPAEYIGLVNYVETDEKEKRLKAEAENLRAMADQYKMEDLMADIDNVAARAEQDLETYLSSEEYAARKLTRETEALQRIRMAQAAGMSPEYLGLVSYTEEDETETELRATAEYYRGLATSKKEQQMLTADLQELESWPEEDRQMLIQYALNRQSEFLSGVNPMATQTFGTARYEATPIMTKYGAQRVEEIAESYIRSQNQQTAQNVAQAAQEGVAGGLGGAIGHNMGSVAGNLLAAYTSPMGYLEEMVNRTGRYSTLDPNNVGMLPGTYAGAVRQGTAAQIEENGGGKVGSVVYQAGMSAVDNLARMVAGGGTGSLALAATGSFGQAVSQYSAQGATPLEATAMGIVSGGLEVLTEKVSLDNLLTDIDSPKNAMDILKSVLRSGGVEVTEEELSFLGSTLAEAAILREKSSYNRRIAELQAYGLTREQAKEQASLGVIEEAAMTAVQSFLSGGMMAGATAGYSNAMNAIQSRADGRQLEQTVQEASRQIMAGADTGKTGSVSYQEGVQVSKEMAESVQRMAAATGRQIQVYNSQQGEDGFYDPNTGILHISTNSRDPVAQVIGHELTHSVEMAEAYKEIKSLVLKRLQEKGTNLEQLRQEKRAQYASHGVQLKNDADIDSEIVASYVAGNLLTNEQSITSLVQENPGLGQRILNWLEDLMAKFGNENARERAFVRKTRDAYARALDQTGRTSLPTGSQTGTGVETGGTEGEGGAQMDSLMEQMTGMYRSGDISEEEYDSFLESYNSYMEQQGADPMAREDARFRERKDGGKQFSFAGENAATADLQALEQAKALEQQGADNESIRQETGWFRGMDKKWRFEIDDSGMKYHRAGDAKFSEMHEDYARHQQLMNRMLYDGLTDAEAEELRQLDEIWGRERGRLSERVDRGNAQLQNILRHDELFEAYPQLRGASVKFAELEDGVNGRYDGNNNTILLSKKLRNAPESTLLHEIQHAIQGIEGFASGASVEYWKEQRKDIVETIGAARKNLDLWLDDIGYPKARNESLLAVSRRQKTLEQHWKDMAEFKANSQYARQIANCEAEIAEFQKQYDEITNGMTAYEQYENTAGEIEARDTAGRRKLDAEGRKNAPPNLGDENTVFVDINQRIESLDAEYGPQENNYRDTVISEAEIEEGIQQVAAMDPVVRITGDEFAKGEVDLITQVEQYFETLDNVAHNEQLGDVILDRKGVKSDIGHGIGRKKAASFAAVKDVIEQGRVVDYQVNWKKRGYDTAVVAAPIAIGAEEHMAVVIMIRSNKTNRFYVHEVTTTKNGALPFKTGAQKKGDPGGDAPSAFSILNTILNVKQQAGTDSNFERSGEDSGEKQFSFTDTTEKTEETPESQTTGIDRESLSGKARDYLKSAERKLLNHIGSSLNVPYHAKRDSLQPIIQEISDEYLRTGTVSQEKTDELFERAYEEGVVVDREFYDQYKHIKDHLRTNSVTISRQDQADIADFRDFRKRAWGTLRIVNDGGLPVDSAYQELQEMAPELFPDSITHPADQLVRMYEVGQSIAISESSLDSYYGQYAEEYKRWQKVDFASAIQDSIADLRTVKRYADDRIKQQDLGEEITLEQAEQLWASLKDARKEYQKVSAKNLLTARDEMQVGRLLRGEVLLEHLEGEENFKAIKAVYEAKQGYEAINNQIARYRRQVRAKRLQEADDLLQTANEWKDKRTGIAYSRETMRRNVFDIVPDQDLANRIVETYFEPVHSAEAESTRFKTEYRDRVRAMKLETKAQKGNLVSEAHAVQLLGEAMDNIRMIEKSRGRMKTRDGKTLTEWQAVVQDLWSENPGLDKGKIENAVKEFRKIYDELFAAMNRKRMENGYEPVNYRQGYFPHFQPGDGDGIMKYFGRALGIDVNVEALPTTINGLTHTFKPGIQWFGNAQERLGFNTAYDAVEGFDKYIEGVSSVIHQTENIQKLRALATQARYRTSDEGIRLQVDQVQADPRLTEEEKQMKIREIYEHGKSALSNFVVELDEYTNLLANKKSKYDRTMESFLGRKAYTVMKSVESKVGANMIAGNLSSAFTNFIPLTQAYGRIGTADMLKGMKDACKAVIRSSDDVVARSDFLTNRRGSDVLVKGWQEKLSGKLGAPMEFIDNLVSESIVRASYYQNLRRGLSEQEAMHQADIFAAGVMADRSKGAMPTLFESSNPLFKAFTQFQLEVNNQYSEIFKDIPREYQDKAKWMLASCFFKYFVGAFLWNKFEEWIKGRDSALDPIGIAETFVMDFNEAGFGEAGANLAVNLLEGLPFASALSMVGVEIDGGRVPVSSAMPDFAALWDAATDKELNKAQRWKTATEEIQKPITYLLMPAGGNQAAKIWKGIDAFLEGGSYGLDKDGNETLQYPVYKDDGGDAFWSMVRSMVFGKSSLGTAKDWVKDGFDSLNKFETVVYQDMLEAGVKDRDAYALVDQLRKVPLSEEEGGAQIRRKEQQKILRDSDISGEGRAIAFYGMVASDSEKEFMNELTDAGAAPGNVFEFVIDFKAAKTLDNDERRAALRDVILSSKLTEEEKTYAIRDVLGKDIVTEKGGLTQFGKFLYAQQEGLSADDFMDLYAEGISIDNYLNLTDKGISSDGALRLARELGKINSTDLSSTEKWREQCDAIMAANLSEADQVAALEKVSYKSTGRMIRIGNDHGIEPSICLDLKRILPNYDANGNGSYTQKEVAAAIDAMAGNEVFLAVTGGTATLSNEQKAMLWQLQNSSWKPAKNPFDKEVGQYIYDLVRAEIDADKTADNEEEEEAKEKKWTLEDAIMAQWAAR